MAIEMCSTCQKFAASLHWDGEKWICRHCRDKEEVHHSYFKEVGTENPHDKKGSTAHVRDIKARRIDPKTKKLIYYKPPATYFFQKG